MKEYISKDRAKQFVCGHCNEVCSEEPCEPSACDWMAFIDKEPAADVALCGCGKAEAGNNRLWVLDASPRYYEIYVDNLTGVQYLRTYKGGVCVMVDAEGRPLIWDEE